MEATNQSTREQPKVQVARLSKSRWLLLLLDALLISVAVTVFYRSRLSLETVSEVNFSEGVPYPEFIFCTFSPDASIVAAGYMYQVNLRRVSDGRTWRNLSLYPGKSRLDFYHSVSFSPDNRLISISNISPDTSQTSSRIEFFSVADGKPVCSIQTQHRAYYFAISPQGSQVAILEEKAIPPREGNSVARERLGLWSIPEGKLTLVLPIPDGTEIQPMFAYAPDGKSLAVGHSDGSISLWQLPKAKCIRVLRGPSAPVSLIAFSPRGDIMASVHSHRTIALWKISDGTLIDTIDSKAEVFQIVFSPGGTLIAARSKKSDKLGESTICVWRLSDMRLIATRTWGDWKVDSLAFTADNELLAVGRIIYRPRPSWILFIENQLDKIFRRRPPEPPPDHCGCFTYNFSIRKMRLRAKSP